MTVEQNAGGLAALAATLDEPVDRRALLRAELDAWAEPTDDVASPREISQDLRAELDAWAEPSDDVAPTRENIRRLLKILKRHLGDVLDPQKPMEDGSTFVTPHWASSLLEAMIDGLVDLDRGLAPELLEKSSPALGNAKTTQEGRLDDAIVQAIKIVRQAKLDKNYTGALRLGENQSVEDFVSVKIKATGGIGQGQTYSVKQLKNLPGSIGKRMRLPKNLISES